MENPVMAKERNNSNSRPKKQVFFTPELALRCQPSNPGQGPSNSSESPRVSALLPRTKGSQREAWYDEENKVFIVPATPKPSRQRDDVPKITTSIQVKIRFPEGVDKSRCRVVPKLYHMHNKNLAVKTCARHSLAGEGERSPVSFNVPAAKQHNEESQSPNDVMLEVQLALATDCEDCKVVSALRGTKYDSGYKLSIEVFDEANELVLSEYLAVDFKQKTHRDTDKRKRVDQADAPASPVGVGSRQRKRLRLANGSGTSDGPQGSGNPGPSDVAAVVDSTKNNENEQQIQWRNLSNDSDASAIWVEVPTVKGGQKDPWYNDKTRILRLPSSHLVPLFFFISLPPENADISQCSVKANLRCTESDGNAPGGAQVAAQVVKACNEHAVQAGSPVFIEATDAQVHVSNNTGLIESFLPRVPEDGRLVVLIQRSTACKNCIRKTYNDGRTSAGRNYKLTVEVVSSCSGTPNERVLCSGFLKMEFLDKVHRDLVTKRQSNPSTSSAAEITEQGNHGISEPIAAGQTSYFAELPPTPGGSHLVQNLGIVELQSPSVALDEQQPNSSTSRYAETQEEDKESSDSSISPLLPGEMDDVYEALPEPPDYNEIRDLVIGGLQNLQESSATLEEQPKYHVGGTGDTTGEIPGEEESGFDIGSARAMF